ncbi:MAG: metal-dependent transcriptional regulator [Acidobacteria bacterium]|nr:metal-dependent transcriptional regulator [Acidobacteriota bacterium]
MSSTRLSSSSRPATRSTRGSLIASATRRTASAVEDYLKVIFAHTEWQPEPIGSSELAQRLRLAPSSVSEMVKKLVAQGLVEHAPYGAIELTASGRREALRMVRRHRLVETWLVDQFGYGWDEVHDEAEILEHTLSDRLLEAIDEQLGRPSRDPHGDPIPAADLTIPAFGGVLASTLAPGSRGRVVRISDRDPDVLRALTAAGVGLDSSIVAGQLGPDEAAAVWVATTM